MLREVPTFIPEASGAENILLAFILVLPRLWTDLLTFDCGRDAEQGVAFGIDVLTFGLDMRRARTSLGNTNFY